ncbi:MAG: mevalonate kinase [Candidatus Micrarchaeales archaeon]
MKSSAPCKVILFGEHAVVYDKLGIAAAIGEKTFVEVLPCDEEGIEIVRILEPKFTKISKAELFGKLEKFRGIYKSKELGKLKEFSFVDSIAIVIAECMDRYGYKDAKVEIKFGNMLKGVGRSASKYNAVALGVSKFLGHDLSRDELKEIAYIGDVVAHGGMPSGIDTGTIAMGGYVSYRKSLGITKLDINYKLPLLVVDSGESAKTGIAIETVRKMKADMPDYVNPILDEMDSISTKAIKSLQDKNLDHVGALMTRNHELLRKLNVSTKKLDWIVQFGIDNGALGAKLTAAGQGGCAIVLAKSEEHAKELCSMYEANNYRAFTTSMGAEGTGIED